VAWGENTDADGHFAGQSVVPWDLSNVVAIGAGDYHSVALKADGTVVAWGDDSQGQCNVPAGLTNVIAIVCGGAHNLVLQSDGIVNAWGASWSGQCALPLGVFDVVGIAAGAQHTLLLVEAGTPVPRILNPAWRQDRFSAVFQTLHHRAYVLEFKTSAAETDWTALPPVLGNGSLRLLADPTAAAPRQFYRVRQGPL
jgi:hypothetical protein